MEFSVTILNQSDQKTSLSVVKRFLKGKFAVYQVQLPSQKQDYVLKTFPKNSFGSTQYKKEMLISSLSHRHVIESTPITLHDDDNYGVLTEFADNDDFHNMLVKGSLNTDIILRSYFHQLINGLEYIHSQGIAHLDLKLSNLMLGSDFRLKIIDFDQSQLITDSKLTSRGTKTYRAPEVLQETCMDLAAADMYSVGILLYLFKIRQTPFAETEDQKGEDGWYYKRFVEENKLFWAEKAQLKESEDSYHGSFIELVNGLLHEDPKKRFTIEEVKRSRWYDGPVLSEAKLKDKNEG